jgi:hypothetical protein
MAAAHQQQPPNDQELTKKSTHCRCPSNYGRETPSKQPSKNQAAEDYSKLSPTFHTENKILSSKAKTKYFN